MNGGRPGSPHRLRIEERRGRLSHGRNAATATPAIGILRCSSGTAKAPFSAAVKIGIGIADVLNVTKLQFCHCAGNGLPGWVNSRRAQRKGFMPQKVHAAWYPH